MSAGSLNKSITLYEAALGLGIASGPLLGGALGVFSWRFPFFGTASLMAFGLVFTIFAVKMPDNKIEKRSGKDVLRALKNREVRTNALISLGYSYGFFTILAYTPLTLIGLTTMQLGITYFAWGLLLAVSSVVLVNALRKRFDPVSLVIVNLIFFTILFIALASSPSSIRLYLVVISGLFTGIGNAMFTTFAMEVSPFSRPVSSAAYNFLRWSGAAIAPILSGYIGQTYGILVPFYLSGAIVASATAYLFFNSGMMRKSIGLDKRIISKRSA